MPLNGAAIAALGAGSVLLWSALENRSITYTLQQVISGKKPVAGAGQAVQSASSSSSSGGSSIKVTTPGSGSDPANEALGKLMAAKYGWATAQNWQALNYGWGTLESGWNANARNASSGAYGIAQALGHGTPETAAADGENNYGGPWSSVATAKAANGGSAAAQIAWGLSYIKDTYGSPSQVPGWLGQGGYGGY